MKRKILHQLIEWKSLPDTQRKPLILKGARQVGKTWILKHFGKNYYSNFVYINCETTPSLNDIFYGFNTQLIINKLEAITQQKILPGKTLIILDEVQSTPVVLTSLKYFFENSPEYHIAVAGSLLGLMVHEGSGFPVGKCHEINIYPMSFTEFLEALNKEKIVDFIHNSKFSDICSLKSELIELLRYYYFVGGMPEVVSNFIETNSVIKTRNLQNQILSNYHDDMSKHSSEKILPKISSVFKSIPGQLAKENKKFKYSFIKQGARARDYEDSIAWLINAGLVHKVSRINNLSSPIKFYEDFNSYKLFVNDLGLLGAMVNAEPQAILIGSDVFSSYKGSFTEQFVFQQYLSVKGENPFYYSNEKSTLELDFVIEDNSKIYPIEVKAEVNLKSKSLSTTLSKHDGMTALRFSMADYIEQDRITNIPLYLTEEYFRRKKLESDEKINSLDAMVKGIFMGQS